MNQSNNWNVSDNVGRNLLESLLELTRKLPDLVDQLDSGKIDGKTFSKSAKTLLKDDSFKHLPEYC